MIVVPRFHRLLVHTVETLPSQRMYRRSLAALAKRTVVRDPRKKAALLAVRDKAADVPAPNQPPLPIAPPQQQPPSTGATLGFYMMAGIGVSMGFAIVSAVLG